MISTTNHSTTKLAFLFVVAALLGVAQTRIAKGDTASPSAEEIAKKSLAHPLFALEGAEVKATMTLSPAQGAAEQRSILVQSKKVGGLLRSVTRFRAPAAVAGTAFLSIQNDGRLDDQYVFLPKLKNTRRIGAGVDRDSSFMGSDLSYDDLNRKSVRDASFKMLGEEAVDGAPCFKIEATPKTPSSKYVKNVLWIRKSDYAPVRTDAFLANEATPAKTMRILKIGSFNGRNVASELTAEDLKTHHKTLLTLDNVKFDAQLGDADFTPSALSR